MKKLNTITISLLAVSMFSYVPLASALVDAKGQVETKLDSRTGAKIEQLLLKTDAQAEGRGSASIDSGEGKTKASADASVTADVRSSGNRGSDNEMPNGIEKRLEDGKDIPKGILMKLFGKVDGKNGASTDDDDHKDKKDGNGTTTVDVKAPVVFSVSANTGTSTAAIRFFTNERTEAKIRFGTTTVSAENTTIVDTEAGRVHRISLQGLSPDTLYHSVLTATDASGNVKESADFTFRTDALDGTPERDTTPPRILIELALRITKDSARVVWVTSEPADTRLFLSQVGTVVAATGTPVVSGTKLTFFHEAELTGLAGNTTYFYTVASADESGNTAVKGTGTFKTDSE